MHVAYYRVSTSGQSIESQRSALGFDFDKEFIDEGVSGSVPAADRPGFGALAAFIREGDTLHVAAVDRLGRDALDVQQTVRGLLSRGVRVDVLGLGPIEGKTGELILAVLAQVADMEKARILERTEQGRRTARESLARTGQTHRGKLSLGRPMGTTAGGVVSPQELLKWKQENQASIKATADHWKVSTATVKRYMAAPVA
jgi:putative DNA-invertase from lambdoid prophage Rac